MKRTKAPTRKTPLKRTAAKPHRSRKKARTPDERDRWYSQPTTVTGHRCARCTAEHGLDPHHVVYARHVDEQGGDIHDGRNQLVLCRDCHAWTHQEKRLPTLLVRDDTITFARQLFGPGAAYEYLLRYYDPTDDPRVAQLLAEWEWTA